MTDKSIEMGSGVVMSIGFIDLLILFAFLNLIAPNTPIYLLTVGQILFAVGWTVLIGIFIFVGVIILFFIIAAIASS